MKKFALIIFLTLFSSTALADEERHFNFEQLLMQAMQFNHALRASRQQLRSSEYKNRISRTNMLPELAIVASGADNRLASDTTSTSLVFTQVLYQGGRISSERRISQFEYNTVNWSLQRNVQALNLSLRSSWYDLLEGRELEIVAHEALVRLARNVKVAYQFYREGQNWRSDVLQAELALARGEQDLIRANNQVRQSRARVNQLMGKAIDWAWEPVGELKYEDNSWRWADAMKAVEQSHPDTKQAELASRIAQQQVVIARSVMRPQLNLTGRINENRNQTLDTVALENSINLTLTMSVWNWRRNVNEIAARKHSQMQADELLAEKQQTVLLAANQAFLAVQEASMRLTILEKSMQQARENYRVNEIRYREQLATANELLDAEGILSNNQRDRVIALADYLTALAQLEFAIACYPCENRQTPSRNVAGLVPVRE